MHEVLRLAENHARQHGAKRIHRIHLRVGPWSGVAIEALRFAFAALKDKTLAEDAELECETTAALLQCAGCGSAVPAGDRWGACPGCGTLAEAVGSGHELEVAALEVS
jgi:hydrogenase nickel incorporation protein HypA/HybF